MQELRGQPEAGLAASRRADDAGVQVTGVGRIFWPGVDRQIFRPGENDVVPENRVYKGLDVLCRTPECVLSSTFFDLLTLFLDRQYILYAQRKLCSKPLTSLLGGSIIMARTLGKEAFL